MNRLLGATVTDRRSMEAACKHLSENSILLISQTAYWDIRDHKPISDSQYFWVTEAWDGWCPLRYGTIKIHYADPTKCKVDR